MELRRAGSYAIATNGVLTAYTYIPGLIMGKKGKVEITIPDNLIKLAKTQLEELTDVTNTIVGAELLYTETTLHFVIDRDNNGRPTSTKITTPRKEKTSFVNWKAIR